MKISFKNTYNNIIFIINKLKVGGGGDQLLIIVYKGIL